MTLFPYRVRGCLKFFVIFFDLRFGFTVKKKLEASTNPVREEIQLTFDIFIRTTDYLLRSTATTRDDD